MFKTLRNAWTIPELRRKILFTLFIVFLYRVGAAIPVPFIDYQAMQTTAARYSEGILSYLNILSGYAFSKATLLALSVTPYINASIIMQLLTIAIPALERMSKNGEDGRKKIEKITRYVTVGIAIVTAYGYYAILGSSTYTGVTGGFLLFGSGSGFDRIFSAIVIIACYTAGACLVMWLGEKIDEQGIGNGISMILFANIVSGLPSTFVQFQQNLTAKQTSGYFEGDYVPMWLQIVLWVAVIVVLIGSIVFVTYMSDAERRIPVQYAKRTVGRKQYGGQSSNLPIKLNMSGVMPIIFASTIVSLPITIISFFNPAEGTFWRGVYNALSTDSWIYMIVLFILIIAFAYFYISISFNPVEVANNLMQQGGSIPGIRPGRPTALYIKKVLNKVVLMGALFLGIVACFPLLLNIVTGGLLNVISFSGSTLLIVVGVILETVREMEAQMTMRHYKGFLD